MIYGSSARKGIRMNTKGLLSGLILGVGLTMATWAAPSVVEKGSGVVDDAGGYYNECLGQNITWWVHAPYTYHVVTLANGDYVYHDMWFKDVTGEILAQDGTVWTRTGQVSPFVDKTTGGGATHYTSRVTFVSEDGRKMEIRATVHVNFDANGKLRANFEFINCWIKS